MRSFKMNKVQYLFYYLILMHFIYILLLLINLNYLFNKKIDSKYSII